MTATRPRSPDSNNVSEWPAPSTEQVAKYPVVYCIFDLLEVDGEDLTDRPLVERRARLTSSIVPVRPCNTGGLARRLRAPFCRGLPIGLGGPDREAGRRALCRRTFEELVEVEVRLGAGVRHRRLTPTRAAAVPTSEPSSSVTTNRVPSTTPARSAPATPRRYSTTWVPGCESCKRSSRRSSTRGRSHAGTHWTRSALVAQIGFAEWTNDGRLRQPRFLGLRDDKNPSDVVRERPR